jgi:hypothetical protein
VRLEHRELAPDFGRLALEASSSISGAWNNVNTYADPPSRGTTRVFAGSSTPGAGRIT